MVWYRRSLDLGADAVWCWENLALAYYSLGDDARYDDALHTLRDLDPKAAGAVEAEIVRASSSGEP